MQNQPIPHKHIFQLHWPLLTQSPKRSTTKSCYSVPTLQNPFQENFVPPPWQPPIVIDHYKITHHQVFWRLHLSFNFLLSKDNSVHFFVVNTKKSLQTILLFFPTCQVRVIRSYQSCSPSSSSSQSRSQPRLPDRSGHCRTPTANSRAQWALPDLNGEFQIAVGTAGPQPRLPGCSGHCRTSTATSRSQWALPDFNRDFQVAMCTAGPRPRAPDPSGHYRTSTAR